MTNDCGPVLTIPMGARLFCYAPVMLPVILLPYYLSFLPYFLLSFLSYFLPYFLSYFYPFIIPYLLSGDIIFPSWSNRYSFPSTRRFPQPSSRLFPGNRENHFPRTIRSHVSVTVKRVPYAVNLLPASNHTGSVLTDIVPVCPILMPARSTGSFSCPGSCPDRFLFLCLSLRLACAWVWAGAWAWVWAGA